MRDSDLDRAVALARATVGADEDVPAKTYPVRRQDRDESYVIVQLGRTAQPGWVVAVDVPRDDVMTWAANETGTSTVPTKRPSKLSSADRGIGLDAITVEPVAAVPLAPTVERGRRMARRPDRRSHNQTRHRSRLRVGSGWAGAPTPSAGPRAPRPHRAPTGPPRSRPPRRPARAAGPCR